MAFSQVGIANMAIQRLGAKSSITALTDGAPNAIKVNTVWEYILNEVLETIKPRFATVRVALSQSSTSPANTDQYDYAYPLPADYLAVAEGRSDDLAVWPETASPHSIETLSDGTLCLMTDYDSATAGYSLFLTYVRKVADPAKFTGLFCNAFAFRLAAELTFSITEGAGKFDAMMGLYGQAVRLARGRDQKQIYLPDEKENTDWLYAGR